ncbi:unnamed protein product [Peronospora effusa]|uniref:Secreted protein n=1 Tax=Peronospora effusa TaxID=542832 RepID=A0A3M6VRP6_9STRA|nr:hypothetical protein DD238_003068 [Peronospora effusa]CAI5702859.1 unnamed protein product [Peronospora effusa]
MAEVVDAVVLLVVPAVLWVVGSACNMVVDGSAVNKVAASMWLPVDYVVRTEVDGVVKFQIARVVPKAEVCATFTEAEDVANA